MPRNASTALPAGLSGIALCILLACPRVATDSRADTLPLDAELEQLQVEAQQFNPRVQRLSQEAAAAWARVPQARSLPDPMVGGNVFVVPMRMGDNDELRGNLMVSQTLPWLGRLHADAQQAAFEALSLAQATRAERLRVRADVAAAWYRLYYIGQQIQINEANQDLLRSLIEISTSRVEVGEATQGDVLLGTVELSRLTEDILLLRQQLVSTTAMLNGLLNRPPQSPITPPVRIAAGYESWSLDMLRSVADQYQPEIVAARLRTQATNWGVRSARLQRIPNVTFNYEHMFMSETTGGLGHNGADPWQVGASINVPLWRNRYDALQAEAARRHIASRFEVEDIVRNNEAMLADWLERARAANQTAELYQHTILPQARQVLAADQQSYAQGRVEFDRVVADVRNLLTFETSYHRAQTELATAVARLEQLVGGILTDVHVTEEIIPFATEGAMIDSR